MASEISENILLRDFHSWKQMNINFSFRLSTYKCTHLEIIFLNAHCCMNNGRLWIIIHEFPLISFKIINNSIIILSSMLGILGQKILCQLRLHHVTKVRLRMRSETFIGTGVLSCSAGHHWAGADGQKIKIQIRTHNMKDRKFCKYISVYVIHQKQIFGIPSLLDFDSALLCS